MIPSFQGDWEIQVLPGHSFVVLYCKNVKGDTMTLELGHTYLDKFVKEIEEARRIYK